MDFISIEEDTRHRMDQLLREAEDHRRLRGTGAIPGGGPGLLGNWRRLTALLRWRPALPARLEQAPACPACAALRAAQTGHAAYTW